MKGLRTLFINGGVVGLVAILQWAASVNWNDYVSAGTAVIIMGLVNVALRFITTTPVGKSE